MKHEQTPSQLSNKHETPVEPTFESKRVRRVALKTGLRAGLGVDGTHNLHTN